uniref:Uncharacterized protein n=1 Tax=Trypanosoma congolense (strain IL3000) TaxID=1068625 RepID=G0UZ95_TRYCI|nr:hypothetical protein, unlikely [Trypanosoma congolense IL3000]
MSAKLSKTLSRAVFYFDWPSFISPRGKIERCTAGRRLHVLITLPSTSFFFFNQPFIPPLPFHSCCLPTPFSLFIYLFSSAAAEVGMCRKTMSGTCKKET